jgi:hypothetical protein
MKSRDGTAKNQMGKGEGPLKRRCGRQVLIPARESQPPDEYPRTLSGLDGHDVSQPASVVLLHRGQDGDG